MPSEFLGKTDMVLPSCSLCSAGNVLNLMSYKRYTSHQGKSTVYYGSTKLENKYALGNYEKPPGKK